MKTFDVGPLIYGQHVEPGSVNWVIGQLTPVLVQESRTIYKDVAPVSENLSIMFNLNRPLSPLLFPSSRQDLVLQFDVLAKLVLSQKFTK